MKILNGKEIAGFIKERQARQVRALVQSANIQPKLAIVQVKNDAVINTYVNLKKRYGADIGVEVEIHKIPQIEATKHIQALNDDATTHGIIVQLPLEDSSASDEVLSSVDASKDVDGLAADSDFTPATPMAILWLLDGYNVELEGREVAVVGQGRLVGSPLSQLLKDRSVNVKDFDEHNSSSLGEELTKFDIVISATGVSGLIGEKMLKPNAVVVDAGVAVEGARLVGDLADDVYAREDLTRTPLKGGVGPLTVCALFENLLQAATLANTR